MRSIWLYTVSSFLFFTLQGKLYPQTPVTFPKAERYDDGKLEEARNAFWNGIRTSGTEKDLRVIEANAYHEFMSMANPAALKSEGFPAWQPIGRSSDHKSSGRIWDVVADAKNPKTLYVVTSGGGVWKTAEFTSANTVWVSLSDNLPTLKGGAIGFVPPNTLILGTGEAITDGSSGTGGQGLYRSTDGGNNWTQVSTIGRAYSQIIVDSTNPQLVYAAYNVGTGGPPTSCSMLKSTDGGATWRKLSLNGSGPFSVAYNSKQPLVIVVGGFGNVYRSIDSGATWTNSSTGVAGSLGRISVANATTDPNVFYASVGSSATNGLNGVYRSTDAGASWVGQMSYDNQSPDATTNTNPLGTQQSWCNTITVNPKNANDVIVGGLDIYESTDGGTNWSQISNWISFNGNYAANFVHADHHHLCFSGTTLFDCNDGGITFSTSPYDSWSSSLNDGLATLLFVGIDADKEFTFVSGGCQDNGTNRMQLGEDTYYQSLIGDGGYGFVAPSDPSVVYTTYVYTSLYNSIDSGLSYDFSNNLLDGNPELYYNPLLGGGAGEGAPFYPAYDASRDGNVIAFGGNQHMWISIDQGMDNFTEVPPSASTSVGIVHCVHVWKGEDMTNYMWSGGGSSLWRSTDQGKTWKGKSIGELVTGITSNPNDHNEIYVVTHGTGVNQKHFFRSIDGGVTFSSPAVNFPAIGCWTVAFNPNNGMLFVGTDKGVVYSFDHGVNWYPLMNGMPFVEIRTLKLKGLGNDTLLAGTYGRGAFWMDVSQVSGVPSTPSATPDIRLENPYPNPVRSEGGNIGFTLRASGIATISLHDILGRELKVIERSYFVSGHHDIPFSSTGVAPGEYFMMLTSGGRSVTRKIVIE